MGEVAEHHPHRPHERLTASLHGCSDEHPAGVEDQPPRPEQHRQAFHVITPQQAER